MAEDNGYSSGYLAPWDPANYSDPGRYAGMVARRDADARAAAVNVSSGYAPTALPDGVTGFFMAAGCVVFVLVLLSGSGRSDRAGTVKEDPAEIRRMEILEQRRKIAEERTSVALKTALGEVGDGSSGAAIVDFIGQTRCHRNTAGGHFKNRTTVLHCGGRGSAIEGYIGYSYFDVESSQNLPFRGGIMEVGTTTGVFPFNGHNLASLNKGISALDPENRKFFVGGVERVRARGLGRYLKRTECALVRIAKRASASFGQSDGLGEAYASLKSPPRMGCLERGRFRYIL